MMGRACSSHGEKRNAWGVSVGKAEGKRPLGLLRIRWENNIEINVIDIGCDGVDWIYLS
jgi:hypothetical protein